LARSVSDLLYIGSAVHCGEGSTLGDHEGRHAALDLPDTPRHSIAIQLLWSAVPFSVIALWLWHESTTTTPGPTWKLYRKSARSAGVSRLHNAAIPYAGRAHSVSIDAEAMKRMHRQLMSNAAGPALISRHNYA
jgi:hypothetical protein